MNSKGECPINPDYNYWVEFYEEYNQFTEKLTDFTPVFISNRMISSAINEKITSHKEKAPNSYRVSKDEERFNAFSFDVIIFFLLFERVILMVNH